MTLLLHLTIWNGILMTDHQVVSHISIQLHWVPCRVQLLESYPRNGVVETIGNPPIDLKPCSILIHPDMSHNHFIEKYTTISPSIYHGIPTASQRTVMLENNHSAYVKLHYDGIIGRVNRKITRKHALAALETSSILGKAITLSDSLPQCFAFFPENSCNIAVINDNDETYEFGTVYRSAVPFCHIGERIYATIPIFSLLSDDYYRPSDQCLLAQLIDFLGTDPRLFVVNKIIEPIISCYFSLILSYGLQPEWHAQNLLIGFDASFARVYIIARDLDSVDRDITIMQMLGLSNNFESYPYKCLECSQYNYKIKHSFMFDHKIGEYIISPLLNFLEKHYCIPYKKVADEVRHYVSTFVKFLPKDFFPTCWYKFDSTVINQDIKFRPYIEMKNPPFRDER